MNMQSIKVGSYIFTSSIHGEHPYHVDSFRLIGEKGAEIKTHYGSVTFSIFISDKNSRFATMADFK